VGAHRGCLLCAADLQAAAVGCHLVSHLVLELFMLCPVSRSFCGGGVLSVGLSGRSWHFQPDQHQNPSLLASFRSQGCCAMTAKVADMHAFLGGGLVLG
jgi:hypothetical protein